MKSRYRIIDTTLREGEQTPGVSFSLEEKKYIVNGLHRVGIAEIEIGIASPLMHDVPDLLNYCRRTYPQQAVSLWSRCRFEDISYAGTLQPDILSLSIPVSDLHLENRLEKDRNWARRTLSEAVTQAKDLGLRVSVGFEDATRADVAFLKEMALRAEMLGVERIRLADTVGISSPGGFALLIREISETLDGCELAVHTHNDFGMATANAVAALEAGAIWADGTILGLGERAGCARLEELVGYINVLTAERTMAPQQLRGLAAYVATITATAIEPARPLIGEKIFTCETGLHLQGLARDPATYEPYPPERVGAERHLLIGAKSGRRAIVDRLSQLGFSPTEDRIAPCIEAIRNRSRVTRGPLTDAELLAAISTS